MLLDDDEEECAKDVTNKNNKKIKKLIKIIKLII